MRPQAFQGCDRNRLAAEAWGADGDPLILLAHGGGQTRHSWNDLPSRLVDAGFRVIAYDQRGHGQSEWTDPSLYRLDRYAGDVAAIVQAASGGRPVHLVGMSLGGLASLRATAMLPTATIASLTLIDVVPHFSLKGSARINRFLRANASGFADLAEAGAAIARHKGSRKSPPTVDGLRRALREGADGRFYLHWDPARIPQEGSQFSQADIQALDAAARALRVPTALLRGDASDVVDRAGEEAFRRSTPQLEVYPVAGANHATILEDVDQVAEVLTKLLIAASDGPSVAARPAR